MRIVLIGYRGTGKTSVGRRLAERLDMSFYDTDAIVCERAGQTIEEIVKRGGWDLFRSGERKAIQSLAAAGECVVSLGGGAVMDPENVKSLGDCFYVWLVADEETLALRIREGGSGQRPPLSANGLEGEIPLILKKRSPVYGRLADLVIDTSGMEIEAVADRICFDLKRAVPGRKSGERRSG